MLRTARAALLTAAVAVVLTPLGCAAVDPARIPPIATAAGCTLLCLRRAGWSGGGIDANVGIAGPSVDLGPVKVHTGVNLGRWL